MFKVMSFDVVGTLVDFYYEDYVWKEAIPQLYARKTGISFEKARDYVLKEYDRVGSNNIRWFLPEYWFERFSLDEDPIEIFRSHIDKLRFYPEVPSALGKLSQRYNLIIASGAPRTIIAIMIEKLQQYFKHIYSPVSDTNEVKKTPHFYKFICGTMEIKPCSMLHIGDKWYCDFISPREIGAKSLYLDRSGEKSGKFVIRDLNELEDHLVNYTFE